MHPNEAPNGVAEAIKAAGSQAKLAEQLGFSQQFMSKCVRRGYLPPKRAQEVEAQYGIPRARLINPRLADVLDLSGAEA